MKRNLYHIVLIDDHPAIIEVYQMALEQVGKKDSWSFHTEVAHTIDKAIYLLDRISTGFPIDLVILDIRLPPSPDLDIFSGEDLGLRIRRTRPNVKIVIATSYKDPYWIHSIIKNIDPEGFLFKGDFTFEELLSAFPLLILGHTYYSETVKKVIIGYSDLNLILDPIDRRLLYLLSSGIHKMRLLSSSMALTVSALEKRKRRLKEVFGVEGGEDWELLQKAREKGVI